MPTRRVEDDEGGRGENEESSGRWVHQREVTQGADGKGEERETMRPRRAEENWTKWEVEKERERERQELPQCCRERPLESHFKAYS